MSGLVDHGRSRKHCFMDASDGCNLWSHDDQEFLHMDVYTACSIGQYDCVRQHLADGTEFAELDKANFEGWTPLMYAAYVGHDNIVNLLLEYNVNVNARTAKLGATSLMLAASCGNESIVYFLLQNGAKIDAQDNRGWTGLHYATFQGHQNVVKLLLESGANKELREHKQGLTPLLGAAQEGHEVIYEMLCMYGASRSANTNTGESARSLAFRHGNMAIVNITDQHSFHDMPSYFLRSEPGLLHIDSEVETIIKVPPEDKVEGWLQRRNTNLETRIQDGPEAFAKLMSYQHVDAEPLNIPILQGNSDEVASTAASPCNPSVTPKNSESTVGSYEEHFFINCGKTVESARLHKQLQKMNLEKDNLEALERNLEEFTPSFQPTVASFLQQLKLTKYIAVFEEQDVDFETLLTFTDNDLKDVGICLFGPRRKIFRAISRWKEEHQHYDNPPFNSNPAAMHPLSLAPSEVQKLQAQLSQEKQLRVIAEGCVMEERAKRQEIYTRVCRLQEQWRQTEGELEKLEGLKQEIARGAHLPADKAEEFHARLETSISNLSKLASLGTIGANNVIFGNHNTTAGNSSGSSGNSSF